ncbi:MAG: hypothetical protein FJZ16_02245 [Candidatus Omnitrophica bacterium]|nr:hypothetical protein [Candidatus Omnitrophota bacterium]
MITEIGIVAGEIWHYLDEHGESMLSVMLKGIERERDITLMSLGWLGREGHVLLKQEGLDYRIALRRTATP